MKFLFLNKKTGMRITFFLAFIFLAELSVSAQNRYFVYLKDKANSSFSISAPEKFLSKRSIDRRKSQNIALNELDIPVNSSYLTQIISAGAKVVGTSKWLNATLIECSPQVLSAVSKLSFVKAIDGNQDIRGARNSALETPKSEFDKFGAYEDFNYGNSSNQIQQLGVDEMHKKNFTGKGILIAVFDAGFDKANTMTAFAHLFSDKKIIKTYDYVSNDSNVYESHWHGTAALSCIAAKLSGQLVGTAPDADFALYKTEDAGSETRIEEVYWLFAAENADSLGVDVINSSLGYYEFDNPATNYKFEDLNGDKTIAAKAADYAVGRGIIVVNSAGNEGGNAWNHIVTPADADSVIAVGAVDLNGNAVGFSSPGPNAKNVIKPEVSAKGSQTTVAVANPNTSLSSGTSFSSPLIAGMVAGLKQQFPHYSAMKIRELLIKSANKYDTPDNKMGYGIPSYKKFVDLSEVILATEKDESMIQIFPNPVVHSDFLKIEINGDQLDNNNLIEVFDASGKKVIAEKQKFGDFKKQISKLNPGNYFVSFEKNGIKYTKKIAVL